MNIVFCSMDNSESGEWQDYVKQNLLKLHSHDNRLAGAQVNFLTEPDSAGKDKVCEIDLRCYGEPIFIRKSAATYDLAAKEAVEEVARKIDQTKHIPS